MAYGTRVGFEPIREINFSSISGVYAPVGTPLTNHARLITINNNTDQQLYFSVDGVDDHDRLPTNSFKLFDLSANKIRDDGLFLGVGTQFYVREVSASVTSGDLWISVIYAEGGK